jgi:hypothetical protein
MTLSMSDSKSSTSQLPKAATGTKQTIQARSGMAAYIPKGHTLTIINTYGKQVVDFWAFALHEAPTQEELDEEQRNEADFMKGEADGENDETESPATNDEASGVLVEQEKESDEEVRQEEDVKKEDKEDEKDNKEEEDEEDGKKEDEQAEEKKEMTSATGQPKDQDDPFVDQPAKPEDSAKDEQPESNDSVKEEAAAEPKTPTTWSSYIPSVRERVKAMTKSSEQGEDSSPKSAKTWSSYLPSVPYGKKTGQADDAPKEKRNWSSFIPSGKGFSSYIPKEALSSIKEMHRRDPTKSVAEQLYDFSKTPVGAAGLSG